MSPGGIGPLAYADEDVGVCAHEDSGIFRDKC